MKKKICMILCVIWSIMLIGCSKDKDGVEMNIFYINVDGNALVQQKYVRTETSRKKIVEEVIEQLCCSDDITKYKPAIPEPVKIEDFRLKDGYVELVFNNQYLELSKSAEVLLRAAVVQTMVQIPEVSYVSFYIGEEPLKSKTGDPVGLMRAEDFVQNTGSSLKTYQSMDLKLFFANKEGTALSAEKRSDVHYSINTSVEKLVVEQLMKGTSSDKRSATVSNTVKLLGVSVKDGICYVNFDASFLNSSLNQKPDVTIYSIVNSVIVNGTATKVQILVDGSSDISYMGSIDLSVPLGWNAELIEE